MKVLFSKNKLNKIYYFIPFYIFLILPNYVCSQGSYELYRISEIYSQSGQNELALKRGKLALKLVLADNKNDTTMLPINIIGVLTNVYSKNDIDSCMHYASLGKNMYKSRFSFIDSSRIRTYICINLNLANVFEKLKWLDSAEYLYKQNVELSINNFGENSKDYSDDLCFLFKYFVDYGKYDNGLKISDEVTKIQKKYYGDKSLQYASTIGDVGFIYLQTKEYNKAIPKFEESANVFENYLKEDLNYSVAMGNIGNAYMNLKKYSKALPYLHEAYKTQSKLNDTLNQPSTLNNIGWCFENTGALSDAELYYLKSLSFYRKYNLNIIEYKQVLENLYAFYNKLKRPIEAEEISKEYSEVEINSLSLENNGNSKSWKTAFDLSISLKRIQDFKNAAISAREALQFAKEQFSPDSIAYIQTLNLLSKIYLNLDLDSAIFFSSEGIKIFSETYGENNKAYGKDLLLLYDNLAFANRLKKEYEASEKYYLRGYELANNLFGQFDKEFVDAIYSLFDFYFEIGNYLKASIYAKEFKKKSNIIYDDNSLQNVSVLQDAGSVFCFTQEFNLSIEYINHSISINEASFNDTIKLCDAYNMLGNAYGGLNDYTTSEKNYLKALKLKQLFQPPDTISIAITLENIGLLYLQQKQYNKSLNYELQAYSLYKKYEGENEKIKGSLESLFIIYKEMNDSISMEKVINEYRSLNNDTLVAGIGILFERKNDSIIITDVYKELPAFTAGIIAGDIIVSINDSLVEGLNVEEVKNRIRGPNSSIVKISILRKSNNKLIDYFLTRKIISTK